MVPSQFPGEQEAAGSAWAVRTGLQSPDKAISQVLLALRQEIVTAAADVCWQLPCIAGVVLVPDLWALIRPSSKWLCEGPEGLQASSKTMQSQQGTHTGV